MSRATLLIAALLCLGAVGARAQSVPRIKAEIVSFSDQVLTVRPVGAKDTMKVGVRPATRILKQSAKSLADIKAGDFIGATLAKAGGGFAAQEVHIFPDAMRGTGEGLYPIAQGSPRSIVNATVTGLSGDSISLKFRGAGGNPCAGRAPVGAGAAGGCNGAVTVRVDAHAPVIALEPATQADLKSGVVVALSIMAGPDGRPVTPGLTIETADAAPAAAAKRP